jgi:hypothetical protein
MVSAPCPLSVHDITCHVIHFSIVTPIRISPLSSSLLFSSYLLAFLKQLSLHLILISFYRHCSNGRYVNYEDEVLNEGRRRC